MDISFLTSLLLSVDALRSASAFSKSLLFLAMLSSMEFFSASRVFFSDKAFSSSLLSARYLLLSSVFLSSIFSSIVSYLAIFSLRLPPSFIKSMISALAVLMDASRASSSARTLSLASSASLRSLFFSASSLTMPPFFC